MIFFRHKDIFLYVKRKYVFMSKKECEKNRHKTIIIK